MKTMRLRICVRLLFGALLTLLLQVGVLRAEDAVVRRNVNLRTDPSTTNTPIRLLKPPDELEIIDDVPVNGFLHVRTRDDEEGWVWLKNIRRIPVTPAEADIVSSIPRSWDKTDPNHSTFSSHGASCGPFGDDTGNLTNLHKNRTDLPISLHDVTWEALANLPVPVLPKDRDDWTPAQTAEIAQFEGIPVRVVGFIVAIKPQGGSGESTNCHWTASSETDWHIALVEKAGDGEKTSIVIETTPRIRRKHPKWTVGRLDDWEDVDQPVRISGWIMFDPEHRNHLNKFRSTLWEVHPITEIEVMDDQGQWADLDTMP